MTRNEWIAETAREWDTHGRLLPEGERTAYESFDDATDEAISAADTLEFLNVAPWLTPPAPALTDAARRVVEAAVEWNAAYESTDDNHGLRTRVALSDAVNAYKESAK